MSAYVKLIASDGHEFVIERECALASGTIKAMLSGPVQSEENEMGEIRFRQIPSHILAKVCKFLQHKVRYANSVIERPEFPLEGETVETVLELVVAASFLDC